LREEKRNLYVSQIYTILSELLKKNINIKIIINQKFQNPFQKNSNLQTFSRLKSAGIECRLSNKSKILHSKFCISSPNKILLTSANLTQSAFLFNHEISCYFVDVEAYNTLKKYFYELWNM